MSKKADTQEKMAHDLVGNVLKSLKLKYHGSRREVTGEGVLLRWVVKTGDGEYTLKSYLIHDTGYFNLCLWSRDEQNLLHVVTQGYMRDTKTIQAIARERLGKWLRQKK